MSRKENKKYYAAAILDPNSWGATCGCHNTEKECGHRHRTPEAAAKCLNSLKHSSNGGQSFNDWYAFGCVCESTECGHLRRVEM